MRLLRPTVLMLVVLVSACSSAGTPQPAQTAHSPRPGTAPAATRSPPRPGAWDWPNYHRDPAHTGLAAAAPAAGPLSIAWTRRLDGAVYGQPLAIGRLVVAATEGDSVYGLDRATGTVRWRAHVGAPVPLASLPCGNIDPLGITGTTVYSPATGLVYAVAALALGRPLDPRAVPAAAWPGIVAVAFVASFLAIQTFYAGATRIGAARAALTATIEPLIIVVLAWIFLHQQLAPIQLAGAVLIVVGVVIAQTSPRPVGAPEPATPLEAEG